MASLSAIRAGLATTIQNGVEGDLFTYDTLPDNPQLPCVLVEPADADFEGAMTRGMDTWFFHLYVLCSRGDSAASQQELDTFISGSGPNSIRRVLYGRPDLNLDDGTDASVQGMFGYGGKLESVGVSVTGAVLRVKVITDGRA